MTVVDVDVVADVGIVYTANVVPSYCASDIGFCAVASHFCNSTFF